MRVFSAIETGFRVGYYAFRSVIRERPPLGDPAAASPAGRILSPESIPEDISII